MARRAGGSLSVDEVAMNIEKCPDCVQGWVEIIPVCIGCDEEPPADRVKCRTCGGDGELSGLALAVRKARGGPPPLQFRGFA